MEESNRRKRLPRFLSVHKTETLNRSYDITTSKCEISLAEFVTSLWPNFIKYPCFALYHPKIIIISVNYWDWSQWSRCEFFDRIILVVWYNWLENYRLDSQRKGHGQVAFSIRTMVSWGGWRRCYSRDYRMVLGMENIHQADRRQRWDTRGI